MKTKHTRLLCAALAAVLALTLTACSAKSRDSYDTFAAGTAYNTSSYAYEPAASEVMWDSAPALMESMDAAAAPENKGGSSLWVPTAGRKVILRADATLEAKNYDEVLQALLTRTEAAGGYLASREDYDYGRREVSLCLRVPSSGFEDFLTGMSEIANVTRLSQSAEDITESYLETQSYLESLNVQQDRLLELMAQAETLEDLLAIEDRLAEVRARLQYYATLKNTYDSQVDYATIYVNLSEVRDYTVTQPTFGEQLLAALQSSGRGFVDFLQALLFGLIGLAPYLIILVPLTLLAVRALRRRSKARAARRAAAAQAPAAAAQPDDTAQ